MLKHILNIALHVIVHCNKCCILCKNKDSLLTSFNIYLWVLYWETGSSDYKNVLHAKKKMVLLRTVYLKVLGGTQNCSSMASL